MQILFRCWADRERILNSWIHAATALGVVVLLLQSSRLAAAKEEWRPIVAEELSETSAKLQPDAAAEVLELKVEVDDRDFPEERVRREYLRAKIYKPEHIESLMRISGLEVSDDSYFGADNKVKLSARLTLPDGTSKVFGEEAIRERTLAQTGERNLLDRMLGNSGQQVRERFLAVGGAEAGAILEYKIERRERWGNYRPYDVFTFQRRGMAIRKAEIVVSAPNTGDWYYRYFVLNPHVGHAAMQDDPKRKTLTLTATEVPPFTEEPLAGLSYSYHALTLMSCYERKERTHLARRDSLAYTIEPSKTGPWSAYSIADFKTQQDYFEITSAIQKLTAEVVGDAKDPAEKAKRIHDRIRSMHTQFLKELKFNKTEFTLQNYSRSLNDLIAYDRKTSVCGIGAMDHLILGMAMYKVAGIESRMVLLPDRRMGAFNRKLPSRAFVQHHALQVKLGDQWVYSMPNIQPWLPLGEIPWYCEGQVALLVKDGPEEFIPVPFSEASKSLIGNGGTFDLTPEGTLTGTARRKYTGNAAFLIRSRLLNRDPAKQRGILSSQISHDFKATLKQSTATGDAGTEIHDDQATSVVSIKAIKGLDTPETPLEIEYRLTLPHFATAAGERLIFKPWIFRANGTSPFSSETRTNAVYFPYALQELDLISIKLPRGYKPEFTEEKSPSSGKALHYKATLAFDPETGVLKLRREYACNIVAVPVAVYPSLKDWYDTMTRIDQQEVVAVATSTEPADKPTPAPASAPAQSAAPTEPPTNTAAPVAPETAATPPAL